MIKIESLSDGILISVSFASIFVPLSLHVYLRTPIHISMFPVGIKSFFFTSIQLRWAVAAPDCAAKTSLSSPLAGRSSVKINRETISRLVDFFFVEDGAGKSIPPTVLAVFSAALHLLLSVN